MTSVSKNVYILKLDHIVKRYDNTYHRTIKMKLTDLKQTHILTLVQGVMIKTLNLVTMQEYLNIRAFWQKTTLKIDLKKLL